MTEIVKIKGVGPVLAKAFAENGFGSADKIATAKAADLATVPGVRIARAKLLIAAAQSLLNSAMPVTNGALDDAKDESKKTGVATDSKKENMKNKKKKKNKKNKKNKNNKKKKDSKSSKNKSKKKEMI